MSKITEIIAKELNIALWQIENTIELFEDGATLPFICRYRKEATGSLDEVAVGKIKARFDALNEIDKRRESIIQAIEKQEKMTPTLLKKLQQSYDLTELEDLYLPYKQKRKTRASVAREKGLEPLAEQLMKQRNIDITKIANSFLNERVENINDALQGARDIIAEQINENQTARNTVRAVFTSGAAIVAMVVKGKETDGDKYSDYFDFSESLKKCQSHRFLAMRRAVEEGVLRLSINPSAEQAVEKLSRLFVRGNSQTSQQVQLAIEDSYKRLMSPSIENEFMGTTKEQADEDSIRVFAENLRQLLLASPLGQKRVLAIDPGFRTGCKVVCLDAQGMLLFNEAIFPHAPQNQQKKAEASLREMVLRHDIQAIAIGNGTASRETEKLVRGILFPSKVQIFVVSENGASIYSASDVAREEFPNQDITVRGAVSIGRRLIDPLAELVKINPKSIGVGQYQHDVDQKKLQKSLDSVVENCVNLVGVNVNTASKQLLTYVSGLTPTLAKNIVEFRNENGEFQSRAQLKKVKRMGVKSFEQCAGFLRITNAKSPLDNSAVHPESYHIVKTMAKDCNCTVGVLLENSEKRKQIVLQKYQTDKFGLPTLKDIVNELDKPGRDPRTKIVEFSFDDTIQTIEDLTSGMILSGIVTNITNFGAFVDIGIKENGLVHISNLKDGFVSNPADVVTLHQHVMVKVIEVDAPRKRVQLSMKDV